MNRYRLTSIALLAAVVLGFLWTGNAAAQQEAPPPAGDAPEASAATFHAYAQPWTPGTLGEHFNAGLGRVNGVIAKVMFIDIAFGALKHDVLDDKKNPVHEQKPIEVRLDQTVTGYQLGEKGAFELDENENRVVVEMVAGTTVQRVGPDGELMTRQGPVKRDGPELPFTVIFLAGGAVFFTFWYGWINLRGFGHAVAIVRGKFSSADDPGEVTPFRALTSALSATVGLGNIAGVAIAVKTGGPGAIFWMMFLGLFGMTAKFHESTLSQLYRKQNEDGSYSGGPMYYLDEGLRKINPKLGLFGRVLAIVFAVFCIGGALGGGNMFQANQAYEGFYAAFVEQESVVEQAKANMTGDELRPLLTDAQIEEARTKEQEEAGVSLAAVASALSEKQLRGIVKPSQVATRLNKEEVTRDEEARKDLKQKVSYGFGLLMATLVAVVVIGGITRIGAATSKIVPTMCLLYVAGCMIVIVSNIAAIPAHVAEIFREAFTWESTFGGFIGVMIIGFTRAAFSSEAGLGSSAIAHSAAKQSHPVREGFVASLEPFVDTIVICFMTAMVVLITDAYKAPQLIDVDSGTAVTLYAFEQTRLGTWFPYVLSVSVVLFAFSTMISWCYYGERAYGYLVGLKTVVIFRLAFVACVFIGSVASLSQVIGFSDLMILSMAFPNILGGLFLVGVVRRELLDYWGQHRTDKGVGT